MKKIILLSIVLFSVLCAKAGEGDELIHLNAGFLFQSTLNVSLGWEKELAYDNAIEFFGEAGDRWTKDPECGKVCRKSFWKHYYWDGGFIYKKSVKRWRNSSLRLYLGLLQVLHVENTFSEGKVVLNTTMLLATESNSSSSRRTMSAFFTETHFVTD